MNEANADITIKEDEYHSSFHPWYLDGKYSHVRKCHYMTRAVQQVDRQRYMTLYAHEIIKDQQRYYSIMTNPSHVFASHLLQRTIGQTTHSNRWLLSYECVLPCGCHAYRKPSNRADNDGLMFRANRYYV